MQRITEEDYYKILGVARSASETEINKVLLVPGCLGMLSAIQSQWVCTGL